MIELDDIGAPLFTVVCLGPRAFVYEQANAAVERVTGLAPAVLVGHRPEELFPPEVAGALVAHYAACLEGGEIVEFERAFALPIGPRVMRTTLTPVLGRAGEGGCTRLFGAIVDVTEQHHLQEDLRRANARLAVAVDALGGAPWYYDVQQNAFEISPAFDRLLGAATPRSRTMGMAEWESNVHPDDRGDTCFADILAGRVDSGSITFRMTDGGGDERWVLCRRRAVTEGAAVAGIAGILVDVTQEKRREEALSLQAASDPLTGLANRRRFDEVMAGERERVAKRGQPLSLLMIDIDHFKRYNDGYGHLAGDEVIRKVAACCRDVVASLGGTLARYGGEEFVAVLPGRGTPAAAHVADTLLQAVGHLGEPHRGSPRGIVSISVGVAGHGAVIGPLEIDLVALADAALYRAKNDGRNCYRVAVVSRAAEGVAA